MLKKYLICAASLLRLYLIKLTKRSNLEFSAIQSISPSASIILKKSSRFKLGTNVQVSRDCEIHIDNNAELSIGSRTYFNKRCILSCHNKILIGANCLFGPDVKIYDNNHAYEFGKGVIRGAHRSAPISIGDNCWIASNVVILKGSRIENNCVIGAGCIISGEIPENSIVTANQSLKIASTKRTTPRNENSHTC